MHEKLKDATHFDITDKSRNTTNKGAFDPQQLLTRSVSVSALMNPQVKLLANLKNINGFIYSVGILKSSIWVLIHACPFCT